MIDPPYPPDGAIFLVRKQGMLWRETFIWVLASYRIHLFEFLFSILFIVIFIVLFKAWMATLECNSPVVSVCFPFPLKVALLCLVFFSIDLWITGEGISKTTVEKMQKVSDFMCTISKGNLKVGCSCFLHKNLA